MAKSYSLLTYKILAFPEIQEINSDDCVDWAIEMIELGHENLELYNLAAFSKPTNYFEIKTFVKDVIEGLGLRELSGEEAILSYAKFYIHQIAKSQDIRNNLKELYKFCQTRDYEELVYDFFLLYWAWDQLDYEDYNENHYWKGARNSNIQQIVIGEAKKWVDKYKDYIFPHPN